MSTIHGKEQESGKNFLHCTIECEQDSPLHLSHETINIYSINEMHPNTKAWTTHEQTLTIYRQSIALDSTNYFEGLDSPDNQ